MAWGISDLFKAINNQKGFQGEGGGSGVKTPVTTVADSDYGRQLRGDKSPEYSDMLEGQDTNREERNLARRFDPSNEEEVLRMQQYLNKMGYTDEEGNPLAEDSMFGAKTERALRSFQGVPYEDTPAYDDTAVSEEVPGEVNKPPSGGAPGSWAQWLFEGKDPWGFRKNSGAPSDSTSVREDYPEDFGGDQGPY
jgi:hypothetical protein